MDDTTIRLECLKLAVGNPSNSNHVLKAREYYAFVTENQDNAPKGKKGPAK